MERGSALAVVGAQWGDEGKGKIVDWYARDADWVVRFQGGANAGHTLVVDGRKTVLHLVPSGILHPGPVCAIAAGCVVDPLALVDEIEALERGGVRIPPERLRLSRRAHLVLPVHRRLDAAREQALGDDAIGTTGRGIGPAYEDAVARRGVRFVDLTEPEVLRARVEGLLAERNLLLRALGAEPAEVDETVKALSRAAERLRPYLADVSAELAADPDARVVLEGAQGALLDVKHGTYPYVTSSATVAGGACVGVGLGPTRIRDVLGVVKAYSTRVGAGPFPSELEGAVGERLRHVGAEFGATTGRPRRCGWLDAVALRYSARINGLTGLVITKLDVLSALDTLQICVGYEIDGERVDDMPASGARLERARPIVESVPGWSASIEGVRAWDDLPAAARAYVERVESLAGAEARLISVGPGRDAIIERPATD